MGFLQRVVLNSIVFLAMSGFFPNTLYVNSFALAVLAAFVLGILNMFVKPILVILSLPITILTLGVFYLFINAFMLELTATLMGNAFQLNGFSSALLVAVILSIVNTIITSYVEK